MKKIYPKKTSAFSFIEFMMLFSIIFILVAAVLAAVIPFITNGAKKQNSIEHVSKSALEEDCTKRFSSYCNSCDEHRCTACTLYECDYGSCPDSGSCTCRKCSEMFQGCSECNLQQCLKCDDTHYLGYGRCLPCPDNAVCDGISAKIKCSVENCSKCDKDGTCLGCNHGYFLSIDRKACILENNSFECSGYNFIQIGNLCVTKRNMGDSDIFLISSAVSVTRAGNHCGSNSSECCWRGRTVKNCDSSASYSGCSRTVCNAAAAEEICSKFNYGGKKWRLPTASEMEQWGENITSIGKNGLMLCSPSKTASFAGCFLSQNSNLCPGAKNDSCFPHFIWGARLRGETRYYSGTISDEKLHINAANPSFAGSVRCVTEME